MKTLRVVGTNSPPQGGAISSWALFVGVFCFLIEGEYLYTEHTTSPYCSLFLHFPGDFLSLLASEFAKLTQGQCLSHNSYVLAIFVNDFYSLLMDKLQVPIGLISAMHSLPFHHHCPEVRPPATSPVNYYDGFLTGLAVSVFPFFHPFYALLAAYSSGSMLPNITLYLPWSKLLGQAFEVSHGAGAAHPATA